MSLAAIDIGTRRMGCVMGALVDGAPRVLDVALVEVATDLASAVEVTAEWLASCGAERLVLEHAPRLYMPDGVTAQAAQRMAENWHKGCGIRDALVTATEAMGIELIRFVDSDRKAHPSVSRQTWAHRLLPGHRGGLTQAEARAAVGNYLPAEDMARLTGDDRLDAAGAMLWALLPPAVRKNRGKAPRGPAGERQPMHYRPGVSRGSSRAAAIIQALAAGPMAPGDLVRATGLGSSAVSEVAGQLVRRGTLTQGGWGKPYALASESCSGK